MATDNNGKNHIMTSLEELGWTPFFAAAFKKLSDPSLIPGRVVAEYKGLYAVTSTEGELLGAAAGRFLYHAKQKSDLPSVGDWVAIRCTPDGGRAVIHHVLPRISKFSRISGSARKDNAKKEGEEQIIASNINTVFLMQGLDGNFNTRRLERFLVGAWESGASPVIILNKTDLCADPGEKAAAVSLSAPGVPVHAISAATGQGIGELSKYFRPGETVALIGSSGVGKSTLINRLMGKEVQKTSAVNLKDSKGRHTTVQRRIFALETGGLILDTPGIRGLGLTGSPGVVNDAFDDIEGLAAACRFKDCRHAGEAGCAVTKAVTGGVLDPMRLESYHKLRREMEYAETKYDVDARLRRKAREKSLSREIKRLYKDRRRI